MADVREEGFAIGLKGVKNFFNWLGSLSKNAGKVEKTVSKVKLAPRKRL